jgi:hypothetical protein
MNYTELAEGVVLGLLTGLYPVNAVVMSWATLMVARQAL